jgi:acetyl esterase/lipase
MRVDVPAPAGWFERFVAGFLRLFLRASFRPFIGPRLGPVAQRRWARILSLLMPGRLGLTSRFETIAGCEVQIMAPTSASSSAVVLYLHGGAFCLGSSQTHRGLCSHLAFDSGMPVWIPNYRLAPESPYPCALEDALAVYDRLLQSGYSSNSIVLAGDSAGATLALALAIHLKRLGRSAPAGLALISPITDFDAPRDPVIPGGRGDPMVTPAWLHQGLQWFNMPQGVPEFSPLRVDLSGLPPILVQAGQEEILLPDSIKLEAHAQHHGVACRLEVYAERWHVFHLQAFYLGSSRKALKAMADFVRSSIR